LGKNIQIKNIKDRCLTLRIGQEEFVVCEDREFLQNLSSLINGHYLYYERLSDIEAMRIKVKGEDETLYLTSWLIPHDTDYNIVIVWEQVKEEFFIPMTFDYKNFRKEFGRVTSKINKEYKEEYLKKGK